LICAKIDQAVGGGRLGFIRSLMPCGTEPIVLHCDAGLGDVYFMMAL
jgi:hypothetical protein